MNYLPQQLATMLSMDKIMKCKSWTENELKNLDIFAVGLASQKSMKSLRSLPIESGLNKLLRKSLTNIETGDDKLDDEKL